MMKMVYDLRHDSSMEEMKLWRDESGGADLAFDGFMNTPSKRRDAVYPLSPFFTAME